MATCTACGQALPGGARFCPVCGAPVETGAAAAGERKLATILFADLVGSTALADSQDPERVRQRLERFYDAMTAEIALAGGTVEKFAGDAVMAVFGVPASLEDHAERALHAALAMRRRLEELFEGGLALRIGVNTGEVLASEPREGSALVSGDAVNVAARLEQAAEPGEILVGERTATTVRGAFELAERRVVAAKGKAEGVECRRLVRALSLMRPRGVGGLNRAFVGRDRELALLRRLYGEVVAQGHPRLVTILGDAGIGKTRLVRELWEWLAEQDPQPLQRTGRCLSYGQVAYWALGEVLKEHFGILEGDSPERVRERLGERGILGLALGLEMAGDLHPLVVRDRFQDAWVTLLGELTAERPAAVLIEDLHWAEEELLELVDHLLAAVRGPLLLIGTVRPELLEVRPSLAARSEVIALEPLPPAAADDLLDQLLGGPPPEGLREIVAQAEGSPFFLEEMLGSLLDQGLLAHVDGGWRLQALPSGFALPDTVQAVVAARIDLLEPADKAALQAASVIGRTFWSGPVYELAGEAEPDLRTLEERDFVRRRLGSSLEGEREYAFKHSVTRDVAYAGIPKAKRARLHAAIAEWMERAGGRPEELAPLIAYHYAEAARPEDADLAWDGEEGRLRDLERKAVSWLRRASELAVQRYELDEALTLLHQALEFPLDRETESVVWHEIGRAHAFKYDGEPFWAAMQKAIDLTDDSAAAGDMYSDLARETVTRAGMWRRAPDPERIESWIERALELAPENSATRAKALLSRAWWGGTAAHAAEASAIAERIGDVDLRSAAMTIRSMLAFRDRDYQQSLTWAQRAFDFVDQVSDPDLAADADASAIWPALALGRFREARRLGAYYRDANARLTTHHRVHGVAVPIEIEELLGDWERIRQLREDAEAAVEANLDTPCVRNARSLLLCALAEEIGGNREAASRLLERAAELRMEGHGLVLEGPRVRLALVRGEIDVVERLLGEDDLIARRRSGYHLGRQSIRLDALAALRDRSRIEEQAPAFVQHGTYLEPFALRALGVVREDEALLAQAQERFAALGLTWHAAQTETLLASARHG